MNPSPECTSNREKRVESLCELLHEHWFGSISEAQAIIDL